VAIGYEFRSFASLPQTRETVGARRDQDRGHQVFVIESESIARSSHLQASAMSFMSQRAGDV